MGKGPTVFVWMLAFVGYLTAAVLAGCLFTFVPYDGLVILSAVCGIAALVFFLAAASEASE